MLETEIRSTKTLKERGVDFWDNLKQRNLEFADRLENCNPAWAKRVRECADVVKFKECNNGYLVFRGAHLCRVRGCPICEWRKSRRIAKLIGTGVSKCKGIKASDYWQQLTLSLDPVPVSELGNTLDHLREGFKRLSDLKAWKFKGGFEFISLHWVGNEVKVIIHFLGLCPAGMSGHNYISRHKWKKLWAKSLRQESVPSVEIQKFGAIPFNYVAQKGKMLLWRSLNLEMCPDDCFAEAVEQIHRRKFTVGMGCFRQAMQEENRPKKDYYPSERVAIWRMRTRHFAYLPNPDRDDHDDQYLSLSGICWDKERLTELCGEEEVSAGN